MAFAKHTNDDFARGDNVSLLLGCFREADRGHWFEFAVRPEKTFAPSDFAPDCPHIIFLNESYRFAKVLKTVAWICVDEDETGQPIMEKWQLRSHRTYDTAWAVQRRADIAKTLSLLG